MKKSISFILLFFSLLSLQAQQKSWMLGPFLRPEAAKPIVAPLSTTTFVDPMTGKTVAWESMATFNPAAIARNGEVFVLYRAEEKLGEKEIGGHTSRIGLATSADGFSF
ncbi:hypothetical protein [Algoriphagus aquimarinus]|uniref:hypothetical protein n=1 Tax=Algoriphagus aquimarinus TaxID=237018 RepID=UPI003C6CC917|tara:strand:+ start:61569 stop:61895 length:327 start_codon:yes stop_codon:yes gene_type:complete